MKNNQYDILIRPQSVNIGILTSNLNSANMGCNALTYSALLLLDEISQTLQSQFCYTLFTWDAKESQCLYYKLHDLDIRFVKPVLTNRNKIKTLLQRKFNLYPDFKKAFNSCDIFFEIAGGDSYSDIYGITRPKNFNKCHTMVIKKNTPLVFLPQTIGPFKNEQAKSFAIKGLSYAMHIFARDPISFEKATQYSGHSNISQTVDMAFFMDYQKSKHSGDRPLIGINPSGLLWNGGYTGNNQFGLNVDYRELFFALIESIDTDKFDVVLVPHVLNGPMYHVEDDNKVCRWLKEKYSFCKIAPFFYTPNEAKSYISGLDLLVGSRMHCCIAAYSSGVPIYPLAYSRKFKGLFKEELKYSFGAELDSDTMDSILCGFAEVLQNLDAIKAEMPKRLELVGAYKTDLIASLTHIFQHISRG